MFLAVIKVLFSEQVWLSSCVKWFIRQGRADIQQAKEIVSIALMRSPRLNALKVFSTTGLAEALTQTSLGFYECRVCTDRAVVLNC